MPIFPKSEAELREEQRKIYLSSIGAFILCAAFLGSAHFFLRRIVEFPGDDLEVRLVFLASANLLLVIWVMVGVGMVARGRRHSAEDIGGSAYSQPSPKIALAAAFLQNTLEQFVIASVTLSALIMLAGATAMPFIAASVLLFGVGRVSFLLGYSKGAGGRAFGMAVTAIPSLAAFLLSVTLIVSQL